MERVPVVDLALRVRAAEGEELLRDEPVEVAVLHALVVLVLVAVKVVEVEEAGLLGPQDRPQAVEDGDGVHGHAEAEVRGTPIKFNILSSTKAVTMFWDSLL